MKDDREGRREWMSIEGLFSKGKCCNYPARHREDAARANHMHQAAWLEGESRWQSSPTQYPHPDWRTETSLCPLCTARHDFVAASCQLTTAMPHLESLKCQFQVIGMSRKDLERLNADQVLSHDKWLQYIIESMHYAVKTFKFRGKFAPWF